MSAPPRALVRLLARSLRGNAAVPAILGDLHEDFVRISRTRGSVLASLWYAREALQLSVGHVLREFVSSVSDVAFRELAQDAGHALRVLRCNRGFALLTAAVIGLGVGGATTVFSVLEPLILSPLPFQQPEKLVWIANGESPSENSLADVTSRSGNLRDFRERSRSFAGLTGYMAFFEYGAYTLTGAGEPERVAGVGIAHDFLDVLGARLLYGRGFTADEGRWGGPPAVILPHGFWLRRFAADPGIVGQAITVDEQPRTVVGVAPPNFDFASMFAPGIPVDFLLDIPGL